MYYGVQCLSCGSGDIRHEDLYCSSCGRRLPSFAAYVVERLTHEQQQEWQAAYYLARARDNARLTDDSDRVGG